MLSPCRATPAPTTEVASRNRNDGEQRACRCEEQRVRDGMRARYAKTGAPRAQVVKCMRNARTRGPRDPRGEAAGPTRELGRSRALFDQRSPPVSFVQRAAGDDVGLGLG